MAVSSLMFLLAATFISGKQGAVEFKQGANDLETKVKAVINDVSNGQYPSSANFTCTAATGLPTPPPTISAGMTAQGGNQGCIFLGKVIQFNVGGVGKNYDIYTVAARRVSVTGESVSSFAAAMPIAVDSTASEPAYVIPPPGQTINLTEANNLQSGLVVTKVLQCTGSCFAGTSIGAFGFFGSLGNYGLSQSSESQSGAQTVVTASVPGTIFGSTEAATAQKINSTASTIGPANIISGGSYILICFQNGNIKGSLSIGGVGGQQSTTRLETGQGVASVC